MTETNMIVPAAEGPTLAHIAGRVLNRPLLLHPAKAEVIMQVLEGRLGIGQAAAPPLLTPDANRFVGRYSRSDGSYRMTAAKDGVAILSIPGSLVNRGAWIGASSGLVSYEGIAAQLRDAQADPEVHSILLDIDSPGGEAGGMFALADLVAEVNKSKPVTAMVNDMAASAAYGIASAASEIVVSPTSLVGSIGVVLTHVDRSAEMEAAGRKVTLIYAGAHKVDGNPFGPLSAEVRADLQKEVEALYGQFTSLVGRGRGSRLDETSARATEARVFIGEEAVSRGLADRVASLDTVLAELSTRGAVAAPYDKRKGIAMSNTQGAAPQAENAGITQAQHDAAVNTARAEGATAERSRIASILRHEQAAGREEQAATLALETDLTAEQAGKVLAASPKKSGVASIEDRAKGEKEFGAEPKEPGADAAGASAVDAAWSASIKRLNG